MKKPKRFIVTRPAKEAADILCELPSEQTWFWPAFSFERPEGSYGEIKERLSSLRGVDALFFVSPVAVRFTKPLLSRIPKRIRVYAVGEGTAQAVRNAWGENVNLIYPTGASEKAGSEALFEEIKRTGFPKHLLILRSQEGREWLAEHLENEGVLVEKLSVYEREPLTLRDWEIKALEKGIQEESPVILITSTGAIDIIKKAVSHVPGAYEWLKNGIAITNHDRTFDRLSEEGFLKTMECCTTDAFDLAASMLSAEDELFEVDEEDEKEDTN